MPQTFDQLLTTPSKETLRDERFTMLKGIGLPTHSGYSPGTLSGTGAPNNDYAVQVEIIDAGGLGVATFQYSIDAGTTFSATTTVPSDGAFILPGTGVTLLFADGPVGLTSFLGGDVFSLQLSKINFPVTAWQPGDTVRTLVENDTEALADVYKLVKNIAAGGLVDFASDDWLDLLLPSVYDLERNKGVAAIGVVTLADPNSVGPFVLTSGNYWFQASDGHRYVLSQDVTVSTGGSVASVAVRAESPGSAFNVGNNSITVVVTSVPGLTVNNPDPGSGSWITTAGSDDESSNDYKQRAKNRWSSLGFGSPAPAYDLWAKTADPAVTRTNIRVSPSVAGQVDVVLAGSGGTVGGSVVTAVQEYIDVRAPLGVVVDADSASALNITITATVNVFAAYLAQATVAVNAALTALIASKPIGGTLYLTEIIEAIMTPTGVRNTVVTAPVGDTVAAFDEVITFTNNLTFVAV